MTAIGWLRKQWAGACPTGLPVPVLERCAAVECESVTIARLSEGERGCVSCLEDPGSVAAVKLAALGVLPGVEVELVQRFPAFVFRIGYAEIAVDAELAGRIRVRRTRQQ